MRSLVGWRNLHASSLQRLVTLSLKRTRCGIAQRQDRLLAYQLFTSWYRPLLVEGSMRTSRLTIFCPRNRMECRIRSRGWKERFIIDSVVVEQATRCQRNLSQLIATAINKWNYLSLSTCRCDHLKVPMPQIPSVYGETHSRGIHCWILFDFVWHWTHFHRYWMMLEGMVLQSNVAYMLSGSWDTWFF